jgi:hypothetical protein
MILFSGVVMNGTIRSRSLSIIIERSLVDLPFIVHSDVKTAVTETRRESNLITNKRDTCIIRRFVLFTRGVATEMAL